MKLVPYIVEPYIDLVRYFLLKICLGLCCRAQENEKD
jgi:hypothetical protein